MPDNQSSIISDHVHVKKWIQLLAVLIGVIPLYSSLVIYQIQKGQPPSNQGFIFYMAVICPLSILIALILLRFLCKESFSSLNLKPRKWYSDLLSTLILAVVVLVTNMISQYLLSELLPPSTSDSNIRDLFNEMTGSPGLLIVFAGPLVFFGAASEEFIRIFLLSRLWKVWPSTKVRLAVLIFSAFLFGFIHVYRGSMHVAWTTIYGLIMAFYYYRFGRIFPLIFAHYLTNALQVIVVALAR